MDLGHVIFGSGNDMVPSWHQVITWTKDDELITK